MGTKIPWTDETWNPVVGCTKISAGCKNCYAEKMAIRLNGIFAAKGDADNWAKMTNILKWDYSQPDIYEFGRATSWNGQVELFHSRLDIPLHWRKPRRIFVCSMGDLFHESVPFEFVDKVMLIINKCCPHTFQILTKRPDRMLEYITQKMVVCVAKEMPIPNLWLGVTVENPDYLWRAEMLSQIPAAVRFISFEPLLAPIENIPLTSCREDDTGLDEFGQHIDWVIVGGESGPGARPMHPDWVRSIRDQCHK